MILNYMDLNSKVYIVNKKSGITSKEMADIIKEKHRDFKSR